jgi:hypothetical protein
MIDRPYRLLLAAVPADHRAKATVLVLDDDQQAELERFAVLTLEARDWRAIDEAVLQNLAEILVQETTDHLTKE